ncbi:hypothetical protein CEXT_445771 [Caerostris extrusa]|uniref:Uncharacterized protein n=1 Tax=Caerostris extrusa TaxID=172846 RepID=A0AAV4Y583_CAEEX|nr:hypothetical protein CEXT_445771 [Caerostris extrusa]
MVPKREVAWIEIQTVWRLVHVDAYHMRIIQSYDSVTEAFLEEIGHCRRFCDCSHQNPTQRCSRHSFKHGFIKSWKFRSNLRTTAYNLFLCALTGTFDLKIEGQLLETAGLCIPSNNTIFIKAN